MDHPVFGGSMMMNTMVVHKQVIHIGRQYTKTARN